MIPVHAFDLFAEVDNRIEPIATEAMYTAIIVGAQVVRQQGVQAREVDAG